MSKNDKPCEFTDLNKAHERFYTLNKLDYRLNNLDLKKHYCTKVKHLGQVAQLNTLEL